MYTLAFTDEALAVLDRIPANTARLIRKKLVLLAADPRRPNNNVKALKGQSTYRLRVGDWRVVYKLKHEQLIVYVIEIGPRGSIYD
jgi:mRNA interferase RelE/StbE